MPTLPGKLNATLRARIYVITCRTDRLQQANTLEASSIRTADGVVRKLECMVSNLSCMCSTTPGVHCDVENHTLQHYIIKTQPLSLGPGSHPPKPPPHRPGSNVHFNRGVSSIVMSCTFLVPFRFQVCTHNSKDSNASGRHCLRGAHAHGASTNEGCPGALASI